MTGECCDLSPQSLLAIIQINPPNVGLIFQWVDELFKTCQVYVKSTMSPYSRIHHTVPYDKHYTRWHRTFTIQNHLNDITW